MGVGGVLKRKNIEKCRSLRKNQTDAEGKLWKALRDRGLEGAKFRRQFPQGDYMLDFYSPEYRLCVEVDGGQHYEDGGVEKDEFRTKKLSEEGIRVLRFSNLEVLENIEGVCEAIMAHLKKD